MIECTFLSSEEIHFRSKTTKKIFELYERDAEITDFSILLGGKNADYKGLDKYLAGKKIGTYWTTTIHSNYFIETKGDDDGIYSDQYTDRHISIEDNISARPVLKFSTLSELFSVELGDELEEVFEVDYGEYPQTAVASFKQKELELNYSVGALQKTGKSYTISLDSNVEPLIEYEFQGKKYVRVHYVKKFGFPKHLSNGQSCIGGEYIWIRVEPVAWIVDKNQGIAISKKLLFSGIPFNGRTSENPKFESSDIKKFLDNHFYKDLTTKTELDLKNTDKQNVLNKFKQNVEEKKRLKLKRINPHEFKFDTASEKEIIASAMESGVAVFLHGRSSEGKSARVKQIDPTCEIIYLRTATPESLNGKSVYNQETGEMIDIKPTWLQKLEEKCRKEPDRLHVLFLDEITNALPSIQGMVFNIVLDREVNGKWKLPENARIVAAGNDMEDSLAANQLAEPLFNRFAHVYIETTVENWLVWASKNNIHPLLIEFIKYKRESGLRTEYNGKTPNADPRKWEMASKMLYETKNPEMLRALIGKELTLELVIFSETPSAKKAMESLLSPLIYDEIREEEIIRGAMESGVAVFLHGRSSEGKSARVKQIDPTCEIIYLRNETPESLNGKSVYNQEIGQMIDIKPTWLESLEEKCKREPDRLHILFLDEITNALPSIQGMAFNIVLDREVNGKWKLPENARIVAAGNDMEDSLAANQLAEPLFNRFAHVYIKTTVEDWLKWASENNIHPAIVGFIRYQKEAALRSKYNGKTPNADPRKWELASKMLYRTGNAKMLRSLLGEEITQAFCQFCFQKVITLEDVLKGNYTNSIFDMDVSEKYLTVVGLTQVDEENFSKVREFVSNLGIEFCTLFESLWAQNNERRLELVAELKLEENANLKN